MNLAPEVKTELLVERDEAAAMLAMAEQVFREDPSFAGDAVKEAKARYKALDERRKQITRPLLDAKNSVDGLFKPPMELWARVERLARDVLNRGVAERRAEQTAALEDPNATSEQVAAAIAKPVIPDNARTRSVLRFRVTDESKVPDRYWSLNELLVIADLRAGLEIDGIEKYYEEIVVVR